MRKRIFFLLILLLPFISWHNPFHANAYSKHGPIYVFVDGKEPEFFNDPIIRNGTTLVEFRPVFEMLGLEVGWDAKSKTVTGTKEHLEIKLKIGSNTAYVNGEKVTLSQVPYIVKGRTLVPLRFVAEASGKKVQWDRNTRMIVINDGNFEKADFTFGPNDLNQQLKENAAIGKLGPFHDNQQGATLAEIVNKFGFPDARHDGTPSSDDLPFVLYGDYLLYYLGVPGNDYLHFPSIRQIHVMLPESTTNQDIIKTFGDGYEFESGMYLNMNYNLGEYTVTVETEGVHLFDHPYLLSVRKTY